MKKERVNEGELLQAMRSQGVSSLTQVEAVVLETDGSFSVLKKADHHKVTVLSNVSGYEKRDAADS
jgi:uncharacterized membrane protein YcaP (DUF421 family)